MMDKGMLKINLLAIAGSGMLMLITVMVLYFFRERASHYLRFFLPIPPLGVAAYVFVFNMFKDYGGELPAKRWEIISDVLCSTLISSMIYGVFAGFLVVGIHYLKKYM